MCNTRIKVRKAYSLVTLGTKFKIYYNEYIILNIFERPYTECIPL